MILADVAPAHRAARRSTAFIFAANGFLFACWVPHIPEVKHDLGLSNAALGFALLGTAIGSLLSIAVIGRLTARYGSGRVTIVMAMATYLVAPGSGIAVNLPTLFLALMLWGAVSGGLDVAMNAQAVRIEADYGRPIMSSFHGFWSLGTVLGAGVGGACAGLGISLAAQQATLAAGLAVITWLSRHRLVPDLQAAASRQARPAFDLPIVLLGVAGLCALLAEGSAADWSPVYLRDDLHVSAGHAGIAYAAFTAAMMAGRAVGDRVVLHLGRTRALLMMGSIGAVGLALGLLGDSTLTACLGFACLGIGLSIMVPVFFSAGADGAGAAGPRLAVVTSVSYFGFLIGPAALGPLASATSVHAALWLLPSFTALAVVLGVFAFAANSRRLPSGDTPVR